MLARPQAALSSQSHRRRCRCSRTRDPQRHRPSQPRATTSFLAHSHTGCLDCYRGQPVARRAIAAGVLRVAAAVAMLLPAAPIVARADSGAWQYSTIAALMAGSYDGKLTVGELKRHGDFGLVLCQPSIVG